MMDMLQFPVSKSSQKEAFPEIAIKSVFRNQTLLYSVFVQKNFELKGSRNLNKVRLVFILGN